MLPGRRPASASCTAACRGGGRCCGRPSPRPARRAARSRSRCRPAHQEVAAGALELLGAAGAEPHVVVDARASRARRARDRCRSGRAASDASPPALGSRVVRSSSAIAQATASRFGLDAGVRLARDSARRGELQPSSTVVQQTGLARRAISGACTPGRRKRPSSQHARHDRGREGGRARHAAQAGRRGRSGRAGPRRSAPAARPRARPRRRASRSGRPRPPRRSTSGTAASPCTSSGRTLASPTCSGSFEKKPVSRKAAHQLDVARDSAASSPS